MSLKELLESSEGKEALESKEWKSLVDSLVEAGKKVQSWEGPMRSLDPTHTGKGWPFKFMEVFLSQVCGKSKQEIDRMSLQDVHDNITQRKKWEIEKAVAVARALHTTETGVPSSGSVVADIEVFDEMTKLPTLKKVGSKYKLLVGARKAGESVPFGYEVSRKAVSEYLVGRDGRTPLSPRNVGYFMEGYKESQELLK